MRSSNPFSGERMAGELHRTGGVAGDGFRQDSVRYVGMKEKVDVGAESGPCNPTSTHSAILHTPPRGVRRRAANRGTTDTPPTGADVKTLCRSETLPAKMRF